MNAEISREDEHEDNRLNSELIIPIRGMDDVTASSLPNNIPDDVKEEIILDNNLVRKAFNTSEYEVSRYHASKLRALNFNKRGIIGCKTSECTVRSCCFCKYVVQVTVGVF